MSVTRPSPAPHRRHWSLDPDIVYLNHGSFGACPRPVLEAQQEIRRRMEAEPVRFFDREYQNELDRARRRLADFVGADPEDLVFVVNATSAVNAVLRSLRFERGDELLTTDHEYNACRNALDFAAGRCGAKVVVASLPFPVSSPEQILDRVLGQVTSRTRLALLDHVTSPTGIILPVERLVAELGRLGIETLVDGAHAPGMLPLRIEALGAAYYTGNCHKWLCAPKGAAFLHVRGDRRERIRPLAISHGANQPLEGRSRFHREFDWTGTCDPSPWLSVPAAIRFMGSLLPGGWRDLMEANRALALRAREIVCEALGARPPVPDEMIGSLAAVPLPPDPRSAGPSIFGRNPLQDMLLDSFGIEVPVLDWPSPPVRLVRLSAQIYNSAEDYAYLAAALERLLGG